jgi:hypothetical protein
MNILSVIPKTQNPFQTNAQPVNSARMNKINAFLYLLSAVLANLTAMASFSVMIWMFLKTLEDQCQGPPNFQQLSDQTGRGQNVNGSVCLNNICMYAFRLHPTSFLLHNVFEVGKCDAWFAMRSREHAIYCIWI